MGRIETPAGMRPVVVAPTTQGFDMAKKRTDGEGSIYQRHIADCMRPTGAKGQSTCKCRWQGSVIVDTKPNPNGGRPLMVRRKVSGATKSNAIHALNELRGKIATDSLPALGTSMTVEQWMTYWLTQIAPRRCKPYTLAGYKAKVDYINALMGHRPLDRLTSEHVEDAWDSLLENGSPLPEKARKVDGDGTPLPLSANTVHQAHRILARALKVAVQRKRIKASPCAHMDAPSRVEHELEPPTDVEIDKILAAAQDTWNAARWSVALALGLRQGEALGLRWEDVDLDNGVLRVRQTLMRVKGKGLIFSTPKSQKSRRDIALPPSLLASLKRHRKEQSERRMSIADAWTESGLVFTLNNGQPIDPSVDARRWRDLLKAAGVRHYRLHDARHAAGTMLLAQGVDLRIAMSILGHSQLSVTMRYQHTVDKMLVDAAQKMDQGSRWA